MIRSQLILPDSGRVVGCIDRGDGEPLLLVHGVGLRAEAWQPQIDRFADRFRVIAVDLPGHGESTGLTGDPLLPAYVDWLDRVVTVLGFGPVSLVGHSMGGLLAAGLAVERPQQVARVALLNAVWRRSGEARAAVVARAAQIAAGGADALAPLQRWYGDEACWSELRERTGRWLTGCDQLGYAAAYRAFALGDEVYADRFDAIQCPSLFLTGDLDANSTPAMARAMAAAAGGDWRSIEGHGHMVPLTAPARVNQALSAWLKREPRSQLRRRA